MVNLTLSADTFSVTHVKIASDVLKFVYKLQIYNATEF